MDKKTFICPKCGGSKILTAEGVEDIYRCPECGGTGVMSRLDLELFESEVAEFVARTGKTPTMCLLGYEAYLLMCLLMRPPGVESKFKPESIVTSCGEIKFVVDPHYKQRRTYLVDNDYGSLNGGIRYG